MLKFVSDHFKTKNTRKNIVKRMPFITKYLPDQYKTKDVCDKVTIENDGMLGFIPDHCC